MSLSIILTCYNETPIIFDSYEKIRAFMKLTNITYDVIIVDDGSTKSVREELSNYFQNKDNAVLIFSDRNEGRGAAVTKGIRVSSKEYVCFIDTDLEISETFIVSLYYALINSHADIIIGKRIYLLRFSLFEWVRWLSSRTYFVLANTILKLHFLDTETGIKVFKRQSMGQILDSVHDKRWFWDTEIIAEGLKNRRVIIQEPVFVRRKAHKQSLVSVTRDMRRYAVAIFKYMKRRAR